MANQQKHINGLDEELENQRKRNKILRLLESRLIRNDVNFKKLCISLINNDSNLDKILYYINCYLQSNAVLRAETMRFIEDNVCSWNRCSSIAFTFKYEMSNAGVKAAFNRFDCVLSGDTYGKSYRRFNNRCKYFAVLEGDIDSTIRAHYHAVFEIPAHKDYKNFKIDVERVWRNTGNGNIFYEPVDDLSTLKPRLLPYLFKFRTKAAQHDLLEHFHF